MNDIMAGIDEAGRGPLAGPVVAAAVIFRPRRPIIGVVDSKQLSERQREYWFERITAEALAIGLGQASVAEIDAINILQATFLAMQRAVADLSTTPNRVWIDGNQIPAALRQQYHCRAIVQGDKKIPEISAASIVAKVTRDRYMHALSAQYPQYQFHQHKGYATEQHLRLLATYGPLPAHHRRSFAPVSRLITSESM